MKWKNEAEKKNIFEEEIAPFYDSLNNLAFHLTKNVEDAKDLMQETYFRAFKFFDKFQEGTNLKAWLFKILKNTYINQYRKVKRTPSSVSYDDVEPFVDTLLEGDNETENELEEEATGFNLTDEVASALKKLDDEFKLVIVLADIEGFTYQEIAEILEIPIGTVRSRLSRARKKLQKQLETYAKRKGYIGGKSFDEEDM